MPSETYSMPCVDITGTPDLPSPEAGLEAVPGSRQEWMRRAGRVIARNPGYLLIAAALTGFAAGLMVKRLLSPYRGPS